MKTPEQWMDKWLTTHGLSFEQMIEQAQKEAYNQAIDDALEEIDDYKLEYDDFNDFSAGVSSIPNKDKQSILKLKK